MIKNELNFLELQQIVRKLQTQTHKPSIRTAKETIYHVFFLGINPRLSENFCNSNPISYYEVSFVENYESCH